jgi:hypothetical protein
MVGLEDPTEFRFSQAVLNQQGLQFNEALSGRIQQDIGPLTAIGVLDDKAVLYTPTRKAVIFGTGPNPDGLQGSYSDPQLLPSDVGCIDSRSIINIPDGQFHQSERGIYLLTRALQDVYIGSPVEGLVVGNAVCAAVSLPNTPQVRFVMQARHAAIGAAVGAPGLALGRRALVLTYDSQFQQWSSHAALDVVFAGACIWDGSCVYAEENTKALMIDSDAAYLDFGDTVIPVTITTQWLRLGQLSGFVRAKRLVLNGTLGADSVITIGVAVDYDDTIAYTATLTSSEAIQSGGVIQLRHRIERQKCQAIRFTITDTPVGLPTSGGGCNFSGITLELGMKKGPAKLPAANAASSS